MLIFCRCHIACASIALLVLGTIALLLNSRTGAAQTQKTFTGDAANISSFDITLSKAQLKETSIKYSQVDYARSTSPSHMTANGAVIISLPYGVKIRLQGVHIDIKRDSPSQYAVIHIEMLLKTQNIVLNTPSK